MTHKEIEQNIDNEWDRFMLALWGWASHYTEYWKQRPTASAPFYSENGLKKAIKNMVFTGKTDGQDISLNEWVKIGKEFLNTLQIKKVVA